MLALPFLVVVRWRLCLGWLGAGLLLTGAAVAQPASAPSWQADPVLAALLVQKLVPDPAGYLWVATDDGVRRYDGYAAVPLQQLVRGGAPAPRGYATLVFDRAGTMWIGGEAGLYRFAPATGQLTAVPLPTAPTERALVSVLWLDARTGLLWVGYGSGRVLVLDPARPRDLPLHPPRSPTDGTVVQRFAPGTRGQVWLTTDRLWLLTPRGGLVQRLPRFAAYLVPVPDTHPLQLVSTHGLYELDSASGQLRERLRWLPGSAQFDNRFAPASDARGRPSDWIVQGQRIHLEWAAGPALPGVTRAPVTFADADPAAPTQPTLYQLFRDGAGRWWTLSPGWRGCYKEGRPALVRRLPEARNFANPSVRGIARLPDGRLLVSTYSGSLTQAADSPRAPLRPLAVTHKGQPWAREFYSVFVTRAGRTLFAIEPSSFGELALKTGVATEFRLRATGAVASVVNARTLYQDHQGRLWGGALTGLYQLDEVNRRVTRYRAADPAWPLHQREVRGISEDRAGTLWLATDRGLFALEPITGTLRHYGPDEAAPARRLPTANFTCVLANGPDGLVWVGTRDIGLLALDARRGVVRRLTAAQGMPDAPVATLLPGADGAIWAGTYAGIVRYAPATDQLTVYGPSDGLTTPELNQQAAFRDRDGTLFFGGVGGVFRVAADQNPAQPAPAPRLLFTAVVRGDSVAQWLPAGAAPAPLSLAGTTAEAGFDLTLTDFRAPERTRFHYRLWPADADSATPPPTLTTDHRLRLRGLAAGDYSLEVWGQTADGRRSAARRVAVVVARPWWQHPAALLGGALALLLAGAALQQVRVRRALREARLRTRIAADLHDEVGALLTRVSMRAELLHDPHAAVPDPDVDALLADSRTALATMRDVVWSIDAGADTIGALLDRLRDHLVKTAEPAGLRIGLTVSGLPDVAPLAPQLRQHLYLLAKEAITNAVRHARGATEIRVALHRRGRELTLEVTDDGQPLTGQPGTGGMGLRSLHQRAAALGGQLTVGPRPMPPAGRLSW